MTGKPIVRREQADQDISQAADYYVAEGGERLELRFVDALDAAFEHLERNPGMGSLRYAEKLRHSDLRFWAVKRFPYLIFYVDQPTHIDVWRVLHDKRDLPLLLQDGVSADE